MSSWYMRDNHTFKKLPTDVDEAMAVLRETFDGEGGHYGMLAANDDHKDELGVVHAAGEWGEFAPRARAWLEQVATPSQGEVEYASWFQ